MSRLGGLVPWGLVGGLLIAHHALETRRAASIAALEDRLRRTRARLHTALGIARRLRGERDAERVRYVEAADYVREIERHGLKILRVEDADYLRAERDRAALLEQLLVKLRRALELIADGCERPARVAGDALERKEESWN